MLDVRLHTPICHQSDSANAEVILTSFSLGETAGTAVCPSSLYPPHGQFNCRRSFSPIAQSRDSPPRLYAASAAWAQPPSVQQLTKHRGVFPEDLSPQKNFRKLHDALLRGGRFLL